MRRKTIGQRSNQAYSIGDENGASQRHRSFRRGNSGGTPVFVGTRVPLQNLIDSLKGGESIEDSLDGFPSVKREQVLSVIETGKVAILQTVGDAYPYR